MTETDNLDQTQQEILAKYQTENQQVIPGQILFVGSSLMEFFPIEKMQTAHDLGLSLKIYNRGIRGITSLDLLANLASLIFDLAPSKIFINIGSNDLALGSPIDALLVNYRKTFQGIQAQLPDCQVFFMAYYPVNSKKPADLSPAERADQFKTRNNPTLKEASERIAALASEFGYTGIDVNAGLADEQGNLRSEFTDDGIHMTPAAYEIVLENLRPYLDSY